MELLILVSDFMVNSRLNKLISLYLKPGVKAKFSHYANLYHNNDVWLNKPGNS